MVLDLSVTWPNTSFYHVKYGASFIESENWTIEQHKIILTYLN